MEAKQRYVTDYRGRPAELLRDLADMAGRSGNERLRRMWEREIKRMEN